MQVSLTTELEAVNAMLAVIGEAPVNTLEDSGLLDASMARQLLRDTSREVQTRGWSWNTDKGFPLTPTAPAPGEIIVPSDALQVDPVDTTIDAVIRGKRLWDRRNHTTLFDRTVKCDIIRLLPFEDVPQAARQYIAVRAGRIFQDRTVGSEARNGFTQRDETMALVALQQYEAETADYSMADSYSVSRVLGFRPSISGGWR
ncbi:MAG TPA: hypothetical protein VNR89_04060 [Roseomonas sp.]|nr:hypothetical protein [Roseomonas sp.]